MTVSLTVKDRIKRLLLPLSPLWRRHHFFECSASTVKEWCQAYSLPYYSLQEAAVWDVPELRCVGEPHKKETIGSVTLPEIYLAEVHNAMIIGGHNPVLVRDGVALFDDYMHPDRDLFDYSQQGDLITYGPDDHITVQVQCRRSQGPAIEAGILLSGVYSFNYYHWLFDFLSRFWIIDQFREYNEVPLIIDDNLHPNHLEALNLLNTNRRPLIPIRYGHGYSVQKLLIPSKLAFMPQNYKDGIPHRSWRYDVVSPVAVTFLREKLGVERRTLETSMKTRLYISRRNGKYRKLQDEDKIEHLFSQYQFTVVRPELMSFQEQLDVFSSAGIIAGPQGSGLANILFAPASARVIQFLVEDVYLFSNIAHIIGQRLVVIHGSYIPDSCSVRYQSDYRMEPDDVKKAIQVLIAER